MTSFSSGGPGGCQQPRVLSLPESVHTTAAGREAVELAAMAGLVLDPWEAFVLENALGERRNGKWAAFEVGLVVSRQNGKGAILEARELAGLFLLGERLIIHSAHQFDTSLEAFRRLLSLVEDVPEFSRRVKRISRSHGEEGIELTKGQRIRFRTRTKGGGRGFSGDCVILDECMDLPETAHGALLPVVSARPNPQVWYTGSAVDQFVHENGVVFARVRERGHKGDPSLAFFEWSIDAANPELVEHADATDPARWAQANPALGIRISADHIANEQRSMDSRTFAVERLGAGDWPALSMDGTVISVQAWLELAGPTVEVTNTVCFAFDVSPDRSWASIAAAWHRDDGLVQLEIVDRRRGTKWVSDRLRELAEKHKPLGIVCDDAGPAASLLHELGDLFSTEVIAMNAKEYAAACGLLQDAVEQQTVRHTGQREIENALRGAATRPLSDKWAWSRRPSSADITPLVAVTLAHGVLATAPKAKEPVVVWA